MGLSPFIAVDWGTSRFRAYLVGDDGAVLDSVASEEGMAQVPQGGFARVLQTHCAAWLDQGAPVAMAGMVGSRNGWREVPYVPCPAGIEDLGRGIGCVAIDEAREAFIVPGVSCREDGVPDVMRGEETQVLGCGVADGLVVHPGTHSKWARMQGGQIASFRTFMTGEFYALLTEHSILRLLAREPDDPAGFAKGLGAAKRQGGLTHQAFAARTHVLLGGLEPEQVKPFLSGLLIGSEVLNAADDARAVTLIADGAIAESYRSALTAAGISARILGQEECLLWGLRRIMAAASLS